MITSETGQASSDVGSVKELFSAPAAIHSVDSFTLEIFYSDTSYIFDGNVPVSKWIGNSCLHHFQKTLCNNASHWPKPRC